MYGASDQRTLAHTNMYLVYIRASFSDLHVKFRSDIVLGTWYHVRMYSGSMRRLAQNDVCTSQVNFNLAFLLLFLESSGGSWVKMYFEVKIKLELPHFHVSDTCVSI